MSKKTLLISEDFYSIQGEGKTSGAPAYFIRLANCNLACGATPKFVNQFKKGNVEYDPGTFQGDLHAEGKATWTCDTIPVWARGEEKDFDYLISQWINQGILEDIANGIVHIIWTGGEPLLHQKKIADFHIYFAQYCDEHALPDNCVFVEIETNGTIELSDYLLFRLNEYSNSGIQINCSPKLSNSGQPYKKRINHKAIQSYYGSTVELETNGIVYGYGELNEDEFLNYDVQYKFVVSNEDDVKEALQTFIYTNDIPLDKVVLMPGLDDQKDFHERTRFVMEMAKKYKVFGLTRLHVSAWDKTTGV